MAPGVTVHRNPATVYGTDEWAEENLRWTRNTLRSAEADCIPVAVNMPHYRQWCERHGVVWETFCREQLNAEPAWITKIEEGVAILKGRGHAGPATQQQAARAAELAAEAKPARTHAEAAAEQPRDERGRVAAKSVADDVRNGKPSAGNSASYLTARIARDAPEVLKQMKAGAFKSVRAAARAAGIVRDRTRVEIALAQVRKMTAEELYDFEAKFDEFMQKRRETA